MCIKLLLCETGLRQQLLPYFPINKPNRQIKLRPIFCSENEGFCLLFFIILLMDQ